jgi:transcriptional regulator of acetoin/glycerol metabolism
VILADTPRIERRHLPQRILRNAGNKPGSGNGLCTLAEMEARHIRRVLEHARGNRSEAARILGIDRATLWRKLKRLSN